MLKFSLIILIKYNLNKTNLLQNKLMFLIWFKIKTKEGSKSNCKL
jgi:hypothetical protein